MDVIKKRISILGSTGSIGVQTLQVLDSLNGTFQIDYLTAHKNIKLLEKQVNKYNPKGVVIANEMAYYDFKNTTTFRGEIICGETGVIEVAEKQSNDLVLSALVGFSGVIPTMAAINAGKNVALANKETLVVAGKLITEAANYNNVKILAIDSEHSAILQCLAGEKFDSVEKIILTASGGPFRNTPLNEFGTITKADALKHPNWSMGNKITIDSATMVNKGFEIIEAHWLFGLPLNKIEVVIHPQSIIHSLVQFVDGSVKAQLGLPDMRIPISYALTYPDRFNHNFPRLDLVKAGRFDFWEPDFKRYPCLRLAYQALEQAGTATTILNAANEVCVAAFLDEKIRFIDIPKIIEKSLEYFQIIQNPDLDDIIYTDREIRNFTEELIKNNNY
jgi:1-deoxy-D-xylulose-5-phosphate reductoisomerase